MNIRNTLIATALTVVCSHAVIAATPSASAPLYPQELFWAERSPEQVTDRAQAMIEVLLQKPVQVAGLRDAMTAQGAEPQWLQAIADSPDIYVKHFPAYDELRVINTALSKQREVSHDVGEAEAVQLAKRAVLQLAKRGLLNAKQYQLDTPHVGYQRVGAGTPNGGELYSRVVEYRVTFNRQINGIEVANAGVRLGVHATGALTSIRLGGVSVRSRLQNGMELPNSGMAAATRRVSDAQLSKRFEADVPRGADANIAHARLMYVMPEDVRKANVMPMQVYSFALAQDVAGETIHSRRQLVGYSVIDAAAPAVQLTATHPAGKDPGDKR